MKIVIVYQSGFRYAGHDHIDLKVRELAKYGDTVAIVARYDEQPARYPDGSTPPYETIPIRFERGWTARSVKRRVARFDPDLIHVWSPRNLVSRIALELTIGTGAKLVVNYDDPEHFHFDTYSGFTKKRAFLDHLDKAIVGPEDIEQFFAGLNWRWILEKFSDPYGMPFLHPLFFGPLNQLASGFTAIVRPWVEVLQQRFRKPALLMPLAVDFAKLPAPTASPEETRARLGIDPDVFVFLRSGVIYDCVNDQPNMLAGFADLLKHHPKSILLLCGLDFRPDDTAAVIRRLGIEDNVRWLGFLNADEYLSTIAMADAVLCPGFPDEYNRFRLAGKYAEYLTRGKPIIGYASGIGEELVHGRDALLLSEYTPESVCECMLALVRDPQLRSELGRNAQRKARELFDVVPLAKRMHDFYSQIVQPADDSPETAGASTVPTDLQAKDDRLDQAVRRIVPELTGRGCRNVALYGAGLHTRRLLALTRLEPMNIVCIVDDAPAGESLEGIEVIRPADIGRFEIDAIVLSSDTVEPILARNAETWKPEGVEVVALYGSAW